MQPAISMAFAMRDYPHAREAERAALIELADPRPGMRIVDLQAAGGYLAQGIHARLGPQVELLCVEPVDVLRSRLAPAFRALPDRLDRLCSIADASCDRVIGLAGLHHSPSKSATVQESFRVLKPGGTFTVCDVIEGSPVAHWLNGYVNRYNPAGHQGAFLVPGEVTALLRACGFESIAECRRSVPWIFDSEWAIGEFFRGLFALDRTSKEVAGAVRERFGWERVAGGLSVPWELIYGRGAKPAAGAAHQ